MSVPVSPEQSPAAFCWSQEAVHEPAIRGSAHSCPGPQLLVSPLPLPTLHVVENAFRDISTQSRVFLLDLSLLFSVIAIVEFTPVVPRSFPVASLRHSSIRKVQLHQHLRQNSREKNLLHNPSSPWNIHSPQLSRSSRVPNFRSLHSRHLSKTTSQKRPTRSFHPPVAYTSSFYRRAIIPVPTCTQARPRQ
ncbi:hypothetical protein BU26DRAFT_201544 [Trematosphaeria pertusa]|uniref:Uncharacterized protein n=1 Tax=Trematosphaeria pertusa TaxID=390896 RepID=A0A6A6HTL2_9PLEO|nr:uncharacterized protein BU26DRAFT_201544 [Trematosphaeria pertusa]KAF2240873.1 hypothetical protein BU26DRAFT_201544 [Trematosphaeria pertusa]